MSDFGSTFKTARESKGLTLDQIARETRIGTRFLEAIENEEFHLLPGGIFSRGFVRSYADRLGLDIDKAIADFERLSNYREPQVMEGLRVSSTPEPGGASRAIYPVAIGALIILVAGFYLVTRDSTPAVTAIQPPAPIARPTPAPPAPTPVATPPEAVAEPVADSPLALFIEAKEPTWIKVLTDGTSAVAGEILQPGMTRRFTAQTSITLSIGNAGGLSLRINDKAMRPLGKSGQVRSIIIKPGNLKDFVG